MEPFNRAAPFRPIDGAQYNSPGDYRMDPSVMNANRYPRLELAQATDDLRTAIQPPRQTLYSTPNRTYYPVVPYNTVPPYAPLLEFDIKSLPQTDVEDVIKDRHPPASGAVSLGATVEACMGRMGVIQTKAGEILGTCTLISPDLVMTACHAVEGEKIPELVVIFNAAERALSFVAEADPQYDYAIIKLNLSVGPPGNIPLNTDDPYPGPTVLLHYPLQGDLKVSVHTWDQGVSQYSYHLTCLHDSDFCSSGGAYFDPLRRFTAMHLGASCSSDGSNLHRYALKVQDVVKSHPNSFLFKPNQPIVSGAVYLRPYARTFLIEEEGFKSQKFFTELLGNAIQTDKNIKMTKKGVVAYSKNNLSYLYDYYLTEFTKVYHEYLYVSGYHAFTKQYSMQDYVESDHLIPYDVWNFTNHTVMESFIDGSERRQGEDKMPAITIPAKIHATLLTTGSATDSVQFRVKLITYCNDDKVHKAFIACVKEYKAKGIQVNKQPAKGAILHNLSLYIKHGIIDKLGGDYVIGKMKKL